MCVSVCRGRGHGLGLGPGPGRRCCCRRRRRSRRCRCRGRRRGRRCGGGGGRRRSRCGFPCVLLRSVMWAFFLLHVFLASDNYVVFVTWALILQDPSDKRACV
jgi:hypothetical protein